MLEPPKKALIYQKVARSFKMGLGLHFSPRKGGDRMKSVMVAISTAAMVAALARSAYSSQMVFLVSVDSTGAVHTTYANYSSVDDCKTALKSTPAPGPGLHLECRDFSGQVVYSVTPGPQSRSAGITGTCRVNREEYQLEVRLVNSTGNAVDGVTWDVEVGTWDYSVSGSQYFHILYIRSGDAINEGKGTRLEPGTNDLTNAFTMSGREMLSENPHLVCRVTHVGISLKK
jgi:hypothetical protein